MNAVHCTVMTLRLQCMTAIVWILYSTRLSGKCLLLSVVYRVFFVVRVFITNRALWSTIVYIYDIVNRVRKVSYFVFRVLTESLVYVSFVIE